MNVYRNGISLPLPEIMSVYGLLLFFLPSRTSLKSKSLFELEDILRAGGNNWIGLVMQGCEYCY